MRLRAVRWWMVVNGGCRPASGDRFRSALPLAVACKARGFRFSGVNVPVCRNRVDIATALCGLEGVPHKSHATPCNRGNSCPAHTQHYERLRLPSKGNDLPFLAGCRVKILILRHKRAKQCSPAVYQVGLATSWPRAHRACAAGQGTPPQMHTKGMHKANPCPLLCSAGS